MGQESLQLDAGCRVVTVGGRTTALQEKSWQVLSMLVAHAPEVVTRADIIDQVWQGNFLTGEKGLNQSVWAIRAALCEDSRKPKFIRTVPRVGYQWIHSDIPDRNEPASILARLVVSKAAGMAAVATIVGALAFISRDAIVAGVEPPVEPADLVATRAYLVNQDIHVEFASGCLGILKNADNKEIGTPLLSADGSEIAVTVYEPKGCRLVIIDVTNGERRDFGSCPAV